MTRPAVRLLSLLSAFIVGVSAAWFFAVNTGETEIGKKEAEDKQKKVVCSLGVNKKNYAVLGPDWRSSPACICEEVPE